MVLYRKFRPTTFASVKGQTVITTVLKSAIVHKKISHAYLFTGTRGVGKTSTARIFAKAINCLEPKDGEPCNACESCKSFNDGSNVDLMEIDAASNRGIDDIREIKEKVNFAPTMSIYKVYIIDEVHMLTKDAFNALLKTLEEPPAKVVFILATTEIYKVPLTIISRCQRFDFKNAEQDDLKKLLKEICKKEKIVIDDESIQLITELGEGSFRDSLSILEKLSSGDEEITYDNALKSLGIPDLRLLTNIITAIVAGDIGKAFVSLREAIGSGIDIYQINKNMLSYLEKQLVLQAQHESGDSLLSLHDTLMFIKEFLKAEESLKYSVVPSVVVEAAIASLCTHYATLHPDIQPEIVVQKKQTKKIVKEEKLEKIEKVEEKNKEEEIVPEAGGSEVQLAMDDIMKGWGKVIAKLMPFNHHLSSFLSKSKPVRIEDSYLILEVKYSFHKDRIEETKSRQAIAGVFANIYGVKLLPKCIVNAKLVVSEGIEKKPQIQDNMKEDIKPSKEADAEILKEALKIFEME